MDMTGRLEISAVQARRFEDATGLAARQGLSLLNLQRQRHETNRSSLVGRGR